MEQLATSLKVVDFFFFLGGGREGEYLATWVVLSIGVQGSGIFRVFRSLGVKECRGYGVWGSGVLGLGLSVGSSRQARVYEHNQPWFSRQHGTVKP